jgi:hypothetical protein
MTDVELQECLVMLDEHERLVRQWEPAAPDGPESRCADSVHRTLAHLRACQDAWLAACIAIRSGPGSAVTAINPWRVFDQESYDKVPWADHYDAFLAGREQLRSLLSGADRSLSGRFNGTDWSIEDLTKRLADHEHHHLFTPR